MAVSFRGAGWNTDEDVSSVAVPKPPGLVAGDLMLAAHVVSNAGSLSSMAPPAGWFTEWSIATASGPSFEFYSKIATSSEPASYTFTSPAEDVSTGICAFSGTDSSGFFGNWLYNQYTTATTSYQAPDVNGVVDGMLLSVFFAGNTTNATKSWTTPTGMTERVDTNTSLAYWSGLSMHTQALSSASAVGAKNSTLSNSSRGIAFSIVILPSAGGDNGAMFIPIILM